MACGYEDTLMCITKQPKPEKLKINGKQGEKKEREREGRKEMWKRREGERGRRGERRTGDKCKR